MKRKIIAWVIALIIVAFPFRRAFLSNEPPNVMMMLSFLAVIIGAGLFYYLNLEESESKS